jgi:hypothetical protein
MSNFESLDNLIGAYLYEDWFIDYGDPWAAVEAFVRDEPAYAPLVCAEIRRAVAQANSDSDLEGLLDKFGLGYDAVSAGWASYGAWLLAVAERVDQLLHGSPAA